MDARKRDPRTWALVGCAFVCISRSIAYLSPDTVRPVGLDVLARVLPAWVFLLLWLCAGVLCIYNGVTGKRQPALISLPALPAIFWGLGYIAAQIFAPTSTANWAAGVLYLVLAELIVCLGLIRPLEPRGRVTGEWTPVG